MFLWIVGREMESMYGSRDFLAFYLSAAVFSTLCWVLIDSIAFESEHHDRCIGRGHGGGRCFTRSITPSAKSCCSSSPCPCGRSVAFCFASDLVPGMNGGSSRVAVEAHLAGAGFGFLFKHFDLRWSRLLSGRLVRPRLRIFSPLPREQTRTRSAESFEDDSQRGGLRQIGAGHRSFLRNSSTLGSTRCLPRSRAKGAEG